jgi:hypothetical protein
MDPVTIALLTAGGTALAQNLPALLPSKLAQSNKARLAELKRKEEMGLLGLSDKEQAALASKLRAPAERAQESAALDRERLLAGSGGYAAGQALAEAARKEQDLMSIESQAAEAVLAEDIRKEAEQVDEMRALEAAVEERRRELAGAIGGVVGTTAQAGLTTAAQQAVIQGQKDISPTAVAGLARSLGTSEEEARGLYELSITNPEMFQYLTALQGK